MTNQIDAAQLAAQEIDNEILEFVTWSRHDSDKPVERIAAIIRKHCQPTDVAKLREACGFALAHFETHHFGEGHPTEGHLRAALALVPETPTVPEVLETRAVGYEDGYTAAMNREHEIDLDDGTSIKIRGVYESGDRSVGIGSGWYFELVEAYPPPVDTTLEQITQELKLYSKAFRGTDTMKRLEVLADAISAHARKSQPETVTRKPEVWIQLAALAIRNAVNLNDGQNVVGQTELSEIIAMHYHAAESAAPNLESELAEMLRRVSVINDDPLKGIMVRLSFTDKAKIADALAKYDARKNSAVSSQGNALNAKVCDGGKET